MSLLTPLTLAQAQGILTTQFAAVCGQNVTTDPGDPMLALINSLALLTAQGSVNLVAVANVSRLATSTGGDVDSFCEPFGYNRLPASPSSGTVTFSVTSQSSQPIIVPVGTQVMTGDGVLFVVVADTSQPGYNAGDNGYVIAPNTSSVDTTVTCLADGIIGNVAAGSINQVFSGAGGSVPQANIVTNAEAFINGEDEESDAQYKARFTLGQSTGKVATNNAIAAAILGVQPGLTYSIGDRMNADGTEHDAYFTVFANVLGQNAGPSSNLLTLITNAIASIRSLGVSYQVLGPTLVPVNITATIKKTATTDSSALLTLLTNTFDAFVNNIGLDPNGNPTTCGLGKVYSIFYAVPGLVEVVPGMTLNGSQLDVTAPFGSQLVAGSASFSITS